MPRGRKKISEGGTMPVSAWKTAPPTAWKPGDKAAQIYDDDVRAHILELLWSGKCKSLVAVGRMEGMPSRASIYLWKERFPEFAEELERAQRALGDIYLDEIHTYIDEVRTGTLDPTAGNVVIRGSQWLAAQTDPRSYANRSYVEKNETVSVKTTHINRIEIDGLSDEALDALENALQANLLTGPDGVANTSGED